MPDTAGTFTLADHIFECFLPSSDDEEQVWTITVTKGGHEIRREMLALLHRPIFGPDIDDCAVRDERIEEIIKELGLS